VTQPAPSSPVRIVCFHPVTRNESVAPCGHPDRPAPSRSKQRLRAPRRRPHPSCRHPPLNQQGRVAPAVVDAASAGVGHAHGAMLNWHGQHAHRPSLLGTSSDRHRHRDRRLRGGTGLSPAQIRWQGPRSRPGEAEPVLPTAQDSPLTAPPTAPPMPPRLRPKLAAGARTPDRGREAPDLCRRSTDLARHQPSHLPKFQSSE
jgi:hypothetical protein